MITRNRLLLKIFLPLILIIFIIIIGIAGYMIVEKFNFFDAFYMTIITVATVGFTEVHPLSNLGRLFTSFLIITSFSIFAYAVARFTQFIAEGEILKLINYFKVTRAIDELNEHVIICGYGRNGKEAAHVLKNQGKRFVIIEQKQDIILQFQHKFKDLVIKGDATHDDVLLSAGIERASALITTLPIDADNLFIVLSARQLNNKLTIVSRASDDNTDKKLYAAGANNVIMPDKIGGAHMASLTIKPDVIEFIDKLSSSSGLTQNLIEINFSELPSSFLNKSIKELEIRNKTGANIVGFKTHDGEYIINPNPETLLTTNAKLFILGSVDQLQLFKTTFQ